MSLSKLLADLVKIESYSGHEEKVASFIVDWAQSHGIPVEKQGRNVLIRFTGNASKALILNAHMDTVKPGSLSHWSIPPTGNKAGVMKHGKVFGLGASDDKAAIAAFLDVAHAMKKAPSAVDLFIVFVANEETNGSGSQSFITYFQKQYLGHYQEVAAVIGEPTDLNSIEIGHRGNIFLKVITNGDSGHGSQPEKIKKHAIIENIKIAHKITQLGAVLTQKYKDSVLGAPSFCLTGIKSDPSSVNKVPSRCYSTWDIRTTPKLHDKVVSLIQNEVGQGAKIEHVGQPAPYGLTSSESKVVGLFQDMVSNLKVKISSGSNDICFFTQAGIPAITFGPGKKDVIHKPNEYCEIEKMKQASYIYKKVIAAMVAVKN